jgi:subtilisin family serine protease
MTIPRITLPALGILALAACVDQPVAPISLTPSAPARSMSAAFDSGTFLVRFKGNGVPSGFAEKVATLGGEVIFAHPVGIAAVSGLTAAAADQLAGASGVAAVDADAYTTLEAPESVAIETASSMPSSPVTPDSPTNPAAAPFYGRQWNMKAIHADAAWAAGKLGSHTTKVGVLDTGIDYLHPDLIGRVDFDLSRSFLSSAENQRVQTLFPGAREIADLNYHGTHVAATIASNGLIAAGVTSNVTLVSLKVCAPGSAPNYQGTCPTSGTLAAILYAADNHIPIINMSLGGAFARRLASARGGDGPSFIATINQVMNYARTHGTTIVVSAGNEATDMDHDGNGYNSYCSAPAVICVSATGPTAAGLFATPGFPRLGEYLNIQNIDALASYSNFGRSSINVAAPGGNAIPVWAACSGFTIHPALAGCRARFYDPATGAYNGSVVGLSGTSMAAPHTVGVAALIAATGATSPSAIRSGLEASADDLGQRGTDPAYGKGRVNAARAAGVM